MKFTESPMCTSGVYCGLCRDMERGRNWRSGALRMYPEADVDFVCPKNKPWTLVQSTDGATKVVVKRGPVVTAEIGAYRNKLGGLAIASVTALEREFPGHAVVKIVRDAIAEMALPGDCSQCKRNKMKQRAGGLISRIDQPTLDRIKAVIGYV